MRPAIDPGRARLSLLAVGAAAAFGLVHAAFSAYWAIGGDWLLRTVGAWAVGLRDDSPTAAALGLGAVALVKAVAAVVPVLVAYGRLPWRPLLRAVSWVGGGFLILYGGVNVVVSGAVLAGLITPDGGFDRPAMIGHAFLWDPLFALWGAALVVSLALSRTGEPRDR
ncbi:DUF3995 domain-containing protein [Microlunatus aurantiacus]|uniref:DUF3995 domain-containing protein n=1 Tax=Microlunatus aurantiacus TaxID=446786 RepID=A0ABP7D7N3_9ACTN